MTEPKKTTKPRKPTYKELADRLAEQDKWFTEKYIPFYNSVTGPQTEGGDDGGSNPNPKPPPPPGTGFGG